MCICFTLSQQDSYKCCRLHDGRGHAVVTAKATKHMSSSLCADAWLAEYVQEPESGKYFTGDDECSSASTELAMGFAWTLIWPRVVPKSVQGDITAYPPYITMFLCVRTPRILIAGRVLPSFCNFKIYLVLVALGLCCCSRASYNEQRLFSSCNALANHCGGLSCCGASRVCGLSSSSQA